MFEQEDINFLLTNRIPRRLATQFIGWFSQIEQPLVRDISIGALAAVLRPRSQRSEEDRVPQPARLLHPRAQGRRAPDRSRDPTILVSPCDAIVGACGAIAGTELYQAKGFPYTLQDLLGDRRSGRSASQRPLCDAAADSRACITASTRRTMAASSRATYISGDTWNVNPIALKRVERLFCKNERAVLRTTLAAGGHAVTLVPVAAILVASIRLHFLDVLLHRDASRAAASSPATANFAKATNSAGSSTARRSSSSRRTALRCATMSARARLMRVGQPLMRLA